jgi:TetR/AcrR family transcriptional regulator, transcriptional repressor for nem operon
MIEDAGRSAPSDKAMAMLSLMVGAVTLSRILNDENLSQSFLDAAAAEVKRIAGSSAGA